MMVAPAGPWVPSSVTALTKHTPSPWLPPVCAPEGKNGENEPLQMTGEHAQETNLLVLQD